MSESTVDTVGIGYRRRNSSRPGLPPCGGICPPEGCFAAFCVLDVDFTEEDERDELSREILDEEDAYDLLQREMHQDAADMADFRAQESASEREADLELSFSDHPF